MSRVKIMCNPPRKATNGMHPLHDIDPGPKAPDRINCLIEIPKGSRNKYELDKKKGIYELSRTLYSPMIYPGDYGFIPQSHYDDGDPLDVLVMVNEPTFTGCLIEARPVGIFRMLDKGQADDKILCVPCHNPYFGNVHDLPDVPPHFLMELAHFFAVYKELEGSRTVSLGWDNVTVAHERINHALSLYKKVGPKVASEDPEVAAPRKQLPRKSAAAKKSAPKKSAAKKVAAKKATVKKATIKKAAAKKAAKRTGNK